MVERAGIWRRGLAAAVDLFVTQVVFQGLVAILFALSSGHVTTSYSLYTACDTTSVAPAALNLPRGVTLPKGFVPNQQGFCRSSFFGAPTRVVFVARHVEGQGTTTTTLTQAYSVDPTGRAASRSLDVDALLLPLFVVLRWAADRFLRGSPGRRLARIVVTDAAGTAVGAGLASGLARRYARFAWPFLPGAASALVTFAVLLASGSVPPALSVVNWATIGVAPWAAILAAASSMIRHGDAFYDTPVGTVVTPRREVGRNAPAAAPRDDERGTVRSDAAVAAALRSFPWLSLGLFALMVAVYAAEIWFPAAPPSPEGPSRATFVLYGGMSRELVLMRGQFHRLLTAIFVHGSLVHLLSNGFALMVAGWLVEDMLGYGLFGGVFLAGGLIASLASVSFNAPQQVGIGASGAIQAVLAAAFVIGVTAPPSPRRAWMRAWPLVLGLPALIPTLAVSPLLTVDRADHVGGAIAGLVLGIGLALWRRGDGPRRPSRIVAAVAGGVVAVTALLSVVVGGWSDPTLRARIVPLAEMPADDAGWRERGAALAQRYPDDPRPLLGMASREARDGAPTEALRDLDRSIEAQRRLSPATAGDFVFTAHAELGAQFFGAGDLDDAIAQYGMALALRPVATLFRQRGIAEFYRKRSAEALSDLRQAMTIDPKEAYAVLWLTIVSSREGDPENTGLVAGSVDRGAWPGQVVSFFAGTLDADALRSEAAALDRVDDQHRVCEASFYTGERDIMQQRDDPARPLLRDAVATCPSDFVEHRAALEELAGKAGLRTE